MQLKVNFSAGGIVNTFIEVERTGDVKDARKTAAKALEVACGKKIPAGRLSLIYGGKQLADGMKMHEYSIKHNDTLLAYLKPAALNEPVDVPNSEDTAVATPESEHTSAFPKASSGDAEMLDTVATKLASAEVTVEADEKPIPCDHCDNKVDTNCVFCGCVYCGLKDDETKTLACDECGRFYHMRCLPEPITELPADDWYCEYCVNDPNIVISGEKKLDLSNTRKAKMPSATQTKSWGGGMACAAAAKTCTIVGKDHVGPIPGVHVGQSWRYRLQVTASGVHRPPVGGIAGSSTKPAVSIVLAGGYPEDEDRGEEFTYTGSGGYDLSGNKRTAKVQTSDQELTRQNRSLALACAAEVNEEGAEAEDWRLSTAIRVCRSYKIAKKHPEYAPAEGVRYDGIYRVVRYWKQKGESGHYVWRYLFRRDDSEPAPWTAEGKANIERWGLTLFDESPKAEAKKPAAVKRERKDKEAAAAARTRTKKVYTCTPSPELLEMIRLDTANSRMWATMGDASYESVGKYLEALCENALVCPICQELVQQPVTTACGHNICSPCLCKAMKQYGVICPICRSDIADIGTVDVVRTTVNHDLVTILKALIPSYGRDWETKPKVTGVQRATRSGQVV